jgi:Cu2+-exporting ATPase
VVEGQAFVHGRAGDAAAAERDTSGEGARRRGAGGIARSGSGIPVDVDEGESPAFAVADAVRPESRDAIQRLHDQQIEVVMLTGDAKAVANAVAADLGIDKVFAEVLPATKSTRFGN